LIGLSFFARASTAPVTRQELALIATLFLAGSAFRGLAVYQIGKSAFKFDIVFRQEQRLKEDQLYSLCRHPSYTAMMVVILAYAVTTHSWLAGALGLLSAWAGFQYRIHHEEIALKEQFGEAYARYRARTGMWAPRIFRPAPDSID
jgi:protein-S-isoprenylcysteine O-methyltransferase Ste14